MPPPSAKQHIDRGAAHTQYRPVVTAEGLLGVQMYEVVS